MARKPWKPVDQDTMRASCQALLTELSEEKVKLLLVKRKPTVVFTLRDVMRKCGNTVGSQILVKVHCRESESFQRITNCSDG